VSTQESLISELLIIKVGLLPTPEPTTTMIVAHGKPSWQAEAWIPER